MTEVTKHMDRGACQAVVHRVTKSQPQLSNMHNHMLGYKLVHNKQNTHKKEQVSFSCCEVDESRVYNTE